MHRGAAGHNCSRCREVELADKPLAGLESTEGAPPPVEGLVVDVIGLVWATDAAAVGELGSWCFP